MHASNARVPWTRRLPVRRALTARRSEYLIDYPCVRHNQNSLSFVPSRDHFDDTKHAPPELPIRLPAGP
jgi:hypothetical protein